MKHGLTEDPILLGGSSYCPVDACDQPSVLVHSSLQDKVEGRRGWNDIAV
jgi:hypothetical protein